MKFSTVLCAVDLGSLTGRILYHGAGLSNILGARLRVLHVAGSDSEETRSRVAAICLDSVPYGVPIDDRDVTVRVGLPAAEILDAAASHPDTLIVAGSSGHGTFMKMLLGSTTDALLSESRSPILLIPPTNIDILTTGDGSALTCGAVIAAVDLTEFNALQLKASSLLAAAAACPLYLMTVADDRVSDHDAAQMLKDRGHELAPVLPRAMIVRRGQVVEEISRAARREGAGLVVMGLRERSRGRPGAFAAAMLKTCRAFVLAVPARA